MKKVLYILFIFIVTLSLSNKVYAESCDREDINRLKEIAKNVEIKYEWIDSSEQKKDGVIVLNDYYNLTIKNLTKEIFIFEESDYDNYYFDNSKDGIIEDMVYAGKKKYIIYSSECDKKLLIKEISLPFYNEYSESDNCKGLENKIDACKKWANEDIEEKEVSIEVEKYKKAEVKKNKKNKEKIMQNILKYSLIITLIVSIIVLFVSIFKSIKKRGDTNE